MSGHLLPLLAPERLAFTIGKRTALGSVKPASWLTRTLTIRSTALSHCLTVCSSLVKKAAFWTIDRALRRWWFRYTLTCSCFRSLSLKLTSALTVREQKYMEVTAFRRFTRIRESRSNRRWG